MVSIRTCVGCGERSPQHEMRRFGVAGDGSLVLASARRPRGRAAYLHRRPECARALPRSKRMFRSLRVAVPASARDAFLGLLLDLASDDDDAQAQIER
jgi:predicted RNA-binding protein YlxR (DUF448 family)